MVKVGVIGAGKWGLNHIKSLKKINCEFVGISDKDHSKKEIAEEYKIKFFPDYADLLKEVDAVTVATPTDLHYKTVKDCINAGVNVLVEKPITSNTKESEELVKLAKRKKLILSVGYLFRFNNSIKKLKQLLEKVGEIQYITCRYIHSTKPPRKDSGAIINLGIHPVDIINFITDKKPVSVYAKKKNLLSNKFEDSAIITLDYKDFFATIEVSCTHPEKRRDIWIIAEKEKIYVDYFNQTITRYPLVVTYENIDRKEPIEEKIMPNESLKDELEYFLNLVRNKKNNDLINIGKENYYTTRASELAIESAEKGKEMTIK